MARILVTGFEPFGRWSVNSSAEGARRLAARRRDVALAILPVAHEAAAARLGAAIAEVAPEAVLLTGLAPGPGCRLETLARPGPLAAHAGAPRRGRWSFAGAMAALAATGHPVRLSRDAGGYVCDTTYWAALGVPGLPAVFLHVPPPGPSWPPERLARAMERCLEGGLGRSA